jgi:hypothetical protein
VIRRGRQFSRLPAAEVCGSAGSVFTVLESLCSAVLRGMLDTHSILLLPIHFPSHASPCAMSYQWYCTASKRRLCSVYVILSRAAPLTRLSTTRRRFQWPRRLRRRFRAIHFLGLRVRILTGAWMSVCCECCVWSGRGLCDGLITRTEES